jgi:hypothetical protein
VPRLMSRALVCAGLAAAALACSDDVMKMAGRALIDAGETIRDGAAEADAQASCDACASGNAVRIEGPVTVVTAETDSRQLVGGLVPSEDLDAWQELAQGPVVVTDFIHFPPGDGVSRLAVADVGQCSTARELLTGFTGIYGARLAVPTGKALCGAGTAPARWAGFRPYE